MPLPRLRRTRGTRIALLLHGPAVALALALLVSACGGTAGDPRAGE